MKVLKRSISMKNLDQMEVELELKERTIRSLEESLKTVMESNN